MTRLSQTPYDRLTPPASAAEARARARDVARRLGGADDASARDEDRAVLLRRIAELEGRLSAATAATARLANHARAHEDRLAAEIVARTAAEGEAQAAKRRADRLAAEIDAGREARPAAVSAEPSEAKAAPDRAPRPKTVWRKSWARS